MRLYRSISLTAALLAPLARAADSTPLSIEDLYRQIQELNKKTDKLTQQLQSYQQKATEREAHWRQKAYERQPVQTVTAAIQRMPSSAPGEALEETEAGRLEQLFREAKLNLDARRYPLAISGFLDFIDSRSDHPLASHATYYIGEAEYLQKNWEAAKRTFLKLIATYDRSDRVPFALAKLSQIEGHLGNAVEEARYSELLRNLFPGNPALQE